MADPPKYDKQSRYTEGRGISGAFEGETVTRRRFMEGTALAAGGIASAAFALPALGFALGPVLEDTSRENWQSVSPGARLQGRRLRPARDQRGGRDWRPGKTTVYIRRFDPSRDDARKRTAVRGDLHALRAPRLPRPLHPGVAEVRLPVPRWRVRLPGRGEGGPPVRPLDRFYTRVRNGNVELGDRFSLNSKLERFSPRDPSNHLDGLWQYLYPVETHRMKLPAPPLPSSCGPRRRSRAPTGRTAARRPSRRPRTRRSRGPRRSSAGSTSAAV